MNLLQGKYKVSIITVSYNCENTIEDTILSVNSQDYPIKEHIIIDGASTDNTLAIIKKHSSKIEKFISEPDNGIYDAMNKGIKLASGNIIGILNADDIYYNTSCISAVVNEFKKKEIEAVCSNLVYVSKENINRVVRYYSSKGFTPDKFAYGIMPAHPAFFVARNCYEKFGLFKPDYIIAADFELLARFLRTNHVKYSYLPKVLVKMRTGGISTRSLKSKWILNREIVRACKENDISTNIFKVYSKYLLKTLEFIRRPEQATKFRNRIKK